MELLLKWLSNKQPGNLAFLLWKYLNTASREKKSWLENFVFEVNKWDPNKVKGKGVAKVLKNQ